MSTAPRAGRALAAAALLATAMLLAGGGCGEEEDYDVSCNVDDDCVIVPTRNSCNTSCPSCGRTVINVGELDRYNADLSERECDSSAVTCGTCPEPRAACADGTCSLR